MADIDGDGSGPDRVTSTATDFSDFHYVDPGEPLNLTVTSDKGQVAVAVYDLEGLPDRVTHEGVFFRKDVAGSSLIASSLGEPGQTEITVSFTMPENALQTTEVCYGAPEGYSLAVEVVPGVIHSARCGQSEPFYPAAGLSPWTACRPTGSSLATRSPQGSGSPTSEGPYGANSPSERTRASG